MANKKKRYLDMSGLEILASRINSKFATNAAMAAPGDGKSYVRRGPTWVQLTKLSLEGYSGDTKEYTDVF